MYAVFCSHKHIFFHGFSNILNIHRNTKILLSEKIIHFTDQERTYTNFL